MFAKNVYNFMYSALQEAEQAFSLKEVPVGAVITHNDKIIGKGFNQVEKLKDPTAHAEMIAITSAANHLGNWRLDECDIYVTLEPCIMCAGAILNSRLKNLYFSAFDPKFGACGSVYNLIEEKKYNHTLNIYSGIYESESKDLLEKFFKKIRKS
ncbi:MAG: tRNA-specific adenosine deaminase [Ignavibacteriales bacterium CG_4_9_14_3_um_filter_30_11]|nr:MAG: tRNA-specific adenosine deaminase [Ignavibacteriales bacterium CG_4_9_14_3_um_filter_30_11]